MTAQAVAALVLVLAGTALDVPIVMVLGIVTLLLETIRQVWARYGLRDVTYVRHLASTRTTWGDEIPMTIEVWNRKRLPLAWLRADDETTHGVVVRERALVEGEQGSEVLRNFWTLAPFERVIRHFHVGAERRGVFVLGPVDLAVGDLVARRAATQTRPATQTFLVRPRALVAPGLERPERWGGVDRVRAGLTEDPARFAGVRPYAPGDPLRRIHPRASARLGRPVTKRFEPSRDREVLIALDVQTDHGPAWEVAYDDEAVEDLYVVAASIARSLATERAAFGIAAAGYTGAEARFAHIPISAAPGQVERVLDLLARLSSARLGAVRAAPRLRPSGRAPGDDRHRPDRPGPLAVRRPPPPDRAVRLPGRGRRLRPARGRRRRPRPRPRVRGAQCPARRNVADGGTARRGPMTGADRLRPPVATVLLALPLGLAIIAEAAWISVAAGLFQEYALRQPSLGIVPLAGFVAVGVLAARLVGVRLGGRWPLAAAGLSLAGGAVGWLSSPEARTLLLAGAPGDALAANPAGWFAAIAIARGFAHARLPLSEPTLGHLIGVGVPGLAFAAIAGGMVAEPFRGRFLNDAIVAAIVFATSATLALALTRLAAVGAGSGFDWRRNPWWVSLLTVLVLATAGLALLASSIAAPVIAFVVGASIGPLLLIALVIGFNRGTIRILAIAVVAALVFAGLMNILGGSGVLTIGIGGGTPSEPTAEQPAEVVAVGGGLLLVVAAIALILLARLWMRRLPLVVDDVVETRMIDRGGEPAGGRRRGRRRRLEPTDAVTAYLALVDDLAGRPDVRRDVAETPAEHARRLRDAGGSTFGLDLLAADYALARFAGVTLSAREDRRAVARWRTLRRRLRDDGPRRGRPGSA